MLYRAAAREHTTRPNAWSSHMQKDYGSRVQSLKKLIFGEPEQTDRVGTLSRRLDDVESQLRMLKTEWTDTLERLDRMLGRIVKRSARALASEAAPADLPEPGSESSPASSLDEVAVRRSARAFPGRASR